MPPRRDFRVLRGTRVLAQCGCSGLLGVLDHRQHVSRVGVSSRLHGTYGYLACLGELGITKCDAALFITKLPKAEHDAEEWRAAMQALLLVAEHDGSTMFACIGVRQRSTATLNACSTRRGKTSIGDAASWRGIDDGSLFLRTRT
jgi:hypothetical protein